MASKWKYADLDAAHRIELLKKGNKELFDEEVARTREVTKARRELGLDTTAQENWMDTVGYSYNQYLSDGSAPVSKTGYAKLYLDGKKADTEPSPVKRNRDGKKGAGKSSYYSSAKRRIENAQKLARKSAEERYVKLRESARDELYEKYPYLKEQLLNEGASLEGGKVKRAYELIEKKLADMYAEFDVKLKEELADIDRRYSGFVNELTAHRDGGTVKESLGIIADVLIKNAARKDGYDYTLIPGMNGKKNYYKESSEEEDVNIADTSDTEASSDKAVKPIDDKAVAQDTAEDDSITVEDVSANGLSEYIFKEMNEAADTVKSDPGKAAEAIVKMLIANGMPAGRAVTAASALVSRLMKQMDIKV